MNGARTRQRTVRLRGVRGGTLRVACHRDLSRSECGLIMSELTLADIRAAAAQSLPSGWKCNCALIDFVTLGPEPASNGHAYIAVHDSTEAAILPSRSEWVLLRLFQPSASGIEADAYIWAADVRNAADTSALQLIVKAAITEAIRRTDALRADPPF